MTMDLYGHMIDRNLWDAAQRLGGTTGGTAGRCRWRLGGKPALTRDNALEPLGGIEPQTYALRACSRVLLPSSKPAFACRLRECCCRRSSAVDAVRGHLAGRHVSAIQPIEGRGPAGGWSTSYCPRWRVVPLWARCATRGAACGVPVSVIAVADPRTGSAVWSIDCGSTRAAHCSASATLRSGSMSCQAC
jgi:hypothetical protein